MTAPKSILIIGASGRTGNYLIQAISDKKTKAWETILLTKRFKKKMMAVKHARDNTRLTHLMRHFSSTNDLKKGFEAIR